MDKLYDSVLALIPVRHSHEKDKHDARAILTETYGKFSAIMVDNGKSLISDVAVQDAKALCDTILDCFDYIYSGKHKAAYELLCDRLNHLSYRIKTIGTGECFYRMRLREIGKNFDYKDMLPIPDEKRYLVKTQRYSMPGLPCLYLGYHANACWEEMHRPPIAECMISRYLVIKNFQVLALELPDLIEFSKDADNWIRLFPLIMACMVEVSDYNDLYKSAYVIPQLLMEWLTTEDGAVKQDIKGIRYTSVHINKQFGYPKETFNNLAIPVPGPKKEDHVKELSELFKLTDPTCEEFERIKMDLELGIVDIADLMNPEGIYKNSLFGLIESNLNDEDEFPLKEWP